MRLAPDGRRLAVTVRSLTEVSLWVYDPARGSLSLVTREGEVIEPLWSPDGSRLALGWLVKGRSSLALQPADATGSPRVITVGQMTPASFTPDGRHIIAVRLGNTRDIVRVAAGPQTPAVEPVIQGPGNVRGPALSRDGRWLAYESDVSGRFEVYVRSYPQPGVALPVSVGGGASAAWHPNGREIFFVSRSDAGGTSRMMAVTFDAGSPPRLGRPQPLFEFDPRELMMNCVPERCYDVAPDGQRFYAVRRTPPPASPVTYINLIQNWFEDLKAKVPAGQ